MSARALPGRRLDWYRAGMMATVETGTRNEEGPVSETGGTTDISTSRGVRSSCEASFEAMIKCDTSEQPDQRIKTEQDDDFTQGGGLRRRRDAARHLLRRGQHADAGVAVTRTRGAASRHRRGRVPRRRSPLPGREAAGAPGPGAGPRRQSPQPVFVWSGVARRAFRAES